MWFDPEVVRAAGELAPPWLVVLLAVLSFLGSVYLIGPATVSALWIDDRKYGTWLGVTFLVYGLMALLKRLFSASRPAIELPVATESLPVVLRPAYAHATDLATASFPSGHAMAAVVFWTVVAVDLEVATLRARLAAAASIVAVVSISRIVLGVHYVGDVVGGIAIGLFVVAGVLAIRTRLTDPTGGLLGFAAVVALAAVVVGEPEAVVVLGGTLGALAAWRTTPRGPGELVALLAGRRLVAAAACAVIVTLAGTTLVVMDSPLVVGAVSTLAGYLVVVVPASFSTGRDRRDHASRVREGTTGPDD